VAGLRVGRVQALDFRSGQLPAGEKGPAGPGCAAGAKGESGAAGAKGDIDSGDAT